MRMGTMLLSVALLALPAMGRAEAQAQAATPPAAAQGAPTTELKLSHNDLLELRNLRLEQEVLTKQLENMQLQAQQVQKAMQERAGKIDAMARGLVSKRDNAEAATVDIDYDKGVITYTLPKKEAKP